jgi:uncharacterized protein YbjT (DUF2867 family)
MILVTTTGKVGSEAARLLAQRGVPVRVLAHHPAKAAALHAPAQQRLHAELPHAGTRDRQLRAVLAMIGAAPPEVMAEDNAKALSLFADGGADYVTDDVPKLLGCSARSFEQFVTDYASAFA